MIITKKSLPRRTFLRGAGAALSLPLLDAMIPSMTALADTPASSLFARIGSAIGSEEAVEDGRSTLAKSKPQEVPPNQTNGPTFVPWLNDMITSQRGG